MKKRAWEDFVKARESYRGLVEGLGRKLPGLKAIQQRLVDERGGKAYTVETAVVYNQALDELGPEADMRLILVADNPGRREQAAENRRYLVGPSGKMAENFFRRHPELGIDFRRHVLILNKTPIHTPRTAELADLYRLGGKAVEEAAVQSQRDMAALLAEFHRILYPIPVWIIGYSEMKSGGLFAAYTETVESLYGPQRPKGLKPGAAGELFLYRHFSMNQFAIDLRQKAGEGETTGETLRRIGAGYLGRIFPGLPQ